MALAYFITFTTYGTWLHGSAKGKGSVDRAHNVHGTPFLESHVQREQAARNAMVQPPYVMGKQERDIVCQAIVELARERGWKLLAVHVRTNHVHVVISAERDPGRLMSDLKARASRSLTRAGFDSAERRRWTRHGSTLHLFRDEEVAAKIRYTLDEQGEPMAWYANEPRTK
jgi:REP element-mobilizing transposase RayT